MKQALLAFLLCATWSGQAWGQGSVRIDVTKRGERKIPVFVSAEQIGQGGQRFAHTLMNDLSLSGWFTLANSRQAASLIVRPQLSSSRGALLADVAIEGIGGGALHHARASEPTGDAAALAHTVADDIVQAVIGRPGKASSRIALIGGTGKARELYVVGADGAGLRALTSDRVLCLSPRWGHDRETLTYTSYITGFPDAYHLALLADGRARRTPTSQYPGINIGAHISPDGRRMAIVLSKDGNPELYVKDLSSRRVSRLTQTRFAAEATPFWSPDGREIVYVSDGSRRPQLFIVPSAGGAARQITFDRVHGSENVSPSWGPDGRIAYSSRRGGFYQIVLFDPGTGEHKVLTSRNAHHENPAWAPNGRHIAYARTEGGASRIYILDTMGDPERLLTTVAGQWHSPAWSR